MKPKPKQGYVNEQQAKLVQGLGVIGCVGFLSLASLVPWYTLDDLVGVNLRPHYIINQNIKHQ